MPFKNGDVMTMDEVYEQVSGMGPKLVELTGESHFLQPACFL